MNPNWADRVLSLHRYILNVKYTFTEYPIVFAVFHKLINDLKVQRVTYLQASLRMACLFRNHPELIVGFNIVLGRGHYVVYGKKGHVFMRIPARCAFGEHITEDSMVYYITLVPPTKTGQYAMNTDYPNCPKHNTSVTESSNWLCPRCYRELQMRRTVGDIVFFLHHARSTLIGRKKIIFETFLNLLRDFHHRRIHYSVIRTHMRFLFNERLDLYFEFQTFLSLEGLKVLNDIRVRNFIGPGRDPVPIHAVRPVESVPVQIHSENIESIPVSTTEAHTESVPVPIDNESQIESEPVPIDTVEVVIGSNINVSSVEYQQMNDRESSNDIWENLINAPRALRSSRKENFKTKPNQVKAQPFDKCQQSVQSIGQNGQISRPHLCQSKQNVQIFDQCEQRLQPFDRNQQICQPPVCSTNTVNKPLSTNKVILYPHIKKQNIKKTVRRKFKSISKYKLKYSSVKEEYAIPKVYRTKKGSIIKKTGVTLVRRSINQQSRSATDRKIVRQQPSSTTGLPSISKQPTSTKSRPSVSKQPSPTTGGPSVSKQRSSVNGHRSVSRQPSSTRGDRSVNRQPSSTKGDRSVSRQPSSSRGDRSVSRQPSTTRGRRASSQQLVSTRGRRASSQQLVSTRGRRASSQQLISTGYYQVFNLQPTLTESPCAINPQPCSSERPCAVNNPLSSTRSRRAIKPQLVLIENQLINQKISLTNSLHTVNKQANLKINSSSDSHKSNSSRVGRSKSRKTISIPDERFANKKSTLTKELFPIGQQSISSKNCSSVSEKSIKTKIALRSKSQQSSDTIDSGHSATQLLTNSARISDSENKQIGKTKSDSLSRQSGTSKDSLRQSRTKSGKCVNQQPTSSTRSRHPISPEPTSSPIPRRSVRQQNKCEKLKLL